MDLRFSFSCLLNEAEEETVCNFLFSQNGLIPSRINAIVGKNGVGKTQFLANLVGAMTGLDNSNLIDGARESVAMVIAVSYSVFDRFFLPNEIRIPNKGKRGTYIADELKYRYIGLREKSASGSSNIGVAGPASLARRFSRSIRDLREANAVDEWAEVMQPILRDADFDPTKLTDSSVMTRFRYLGAGHKAILSILTSLFSEAIENSLIVIDEPENHLHPALLSMTMHMLRDILERKKSNAIISTHSPLVIQEVPSKAVRIMRKFGTYSRIDELPRESFGTSLDTLIADIFGVKPTTYNYLSILQNLAERGVTLKDIDDDLSRRLSPEARSYFISIGGKS